MRKAEGSGEAGDGTQGPGRWRLGEKGYRTRTVRGGSGHSWVVMKSEELENQEKRCSAVGEEDNQVITKNN